MAFFAADRIKVSTTTTGTSAFGLSTATSTAFLNFADGGVPDGATVHYAAYTATEFECGEGVYTSAGTTLSRDTIFQSSNGGLIVTFGSSPTVIVTPLAESVVLTQSPEIVETLVPDANDGAALGTTALRLSDLFLADGGVINIGATGSAATITHVAASDSITIAADPDNATATSLINLSIDGTNEAILSGTNFTPGANDGNALGSATVSWADAFLADGGVVNWGNGGVTVTHTAASDSLTFDADSGNALASTQINFDVDGARTCSINATGIAFNADTAAANSLDDYEEGTFTPTIAFGGASVGVTYDTQSGHYTKIGDVVHVSIVVILTSNGTSVGSVTLGTLPFAARATNPVNQCGVAHTDDLSGVSGGIYVALAASGTAVSLRQGVTGNTAAIADTNTIDSSIFHVNITYFV
jgi:hypothetical protein